jgi:hypothetical protein
VVDLFRRRGDVGSCIGSCGSFIVSVIFRRLVTPTSALMSCRCPGRTGVRASSELRCARLARSSSAMHPRLASQAPVRSLHFTESTDHNVHDWSRWITSWHAPPASDTFWAMPSTRPVRGRIGTFAHPTVFP